MKQIVFIVAENINFFVNYVKCSKVLPSVSKQAYILFCTVLQALRYNSGVKAVNCLIIPAFNYMTFVI